VPAQPLPTPAAPAAPKASPIDQLRAGVAGEAAGGARLDVPAAELLAGKEAKVTLSLPDNLLGLIQREAAKVGLGRAARTASVSARLTGEGYSITPNGTQTARLRAGRGQSFSWMVHPTGDAREPLTAAVDARLANGQRFSLLTLQQAVSALPDMAAEAAAKAKAAPGWMRRFLKMLDIPGHEELHLPVFGKMPSHNLVAIGLIALILLLLVNIAGGASRRQARAEARRRRQRAEQGYGLGALGAAALGGAALGAAAEHAVESHHDHGDGAAAEAHDSNAGTEQAYGHEERGHETHAHDGGGRDERDHSDALAAALGGAAVGAVAAHAADEHHAHDDHGEAVEDHGGEAHEAHASDEHAREHHGEEEQGDQVQAQGEAAHDEHGREEAGHAGAEEEHGHVFHNYGGLMLQRAFDDHDPGPHEAQGQDGHGQAHDEHAQAHEESGLDLRRREPEPA
jgi:hypothetical protein